MSATAASHIATRPARPLRARATETRPGRRRCALAARAIGIGLQVVLVPGRGRALLAEIPPPPDRAGIATTVTDLGLRDRT